MTAISHGRIVAIEIDSESLRPRGSIIDDERTVAIHDLLAENRFEPAKLGHGAYRLRLSVADGKLVLDIADGGGEPLVRHILSLTPLRRVVKDYMAIVEAHQRALREPGAVHIEAIDVGRRGLHNEGAELLRERLSERVAIDFPTARRLFTLVCTLYWKG